VGPSSRLSRCWSRIVEGAVGLQDQQLTLWRGLGDLDELLLADTGFLILVSGSSDKPRAQGLGGLAVASYQ